LPTTDVSAQQIIDGYKQIIGQARNLGVAVFGATLTPFKGSFYWNAAAELKRQAINDWIRSSGEFDGVVDFAAVTASQADPLMFAAGLHSGDFLHPND